jgi:hypothetical protein
MNCNRPLESDATARAARGTDRSPGRSPWIVLLLAIALFGAGCASVDTRTRVAQTWKSPAWNGTPLRKIFVISLMETQLGGRAAVEDAIVAQLQAAGVNAIASHVALVSDDAHPEPQLIDAIRASGADGVLLAQVKRVNAFQPYMSSPDNELSAPDPDLGGYYDLFQSQQNATQIGEYKVARVDTRIYGVPGGKQIWGAYTDSYDASNFSRNVPGYVVALIGALERDRMIVAKAKTTAP